MTGGPERAAIVHRAVRTTLAACAGFYSFLYGLHESVMALYGLFAPIALGILSSIPGSGRERAAVMLRTLPVGLVLVTLGTVLAVRTWAAVTGMLVVGFLLAFAAVAGPRPAGAAPGLQLFYILACFPPYAPDTLGMRLAGLTAGVLMLALCEVLLFPEPPTPSYRERLAHAMSIASEAAPRPAAASAALLRATGASLRLSKIPPAQRPAGPGRTDRALSQAGAAARRMLDQLARLADLAAAREDGPDGAAGPEARRRAGGAPPDGLGAAPGRTGPEPAGPTEGGDATALAMAASGTLLRRVASLCDTAAAALRTGRSAPETERLDDAISGFQALRFEQATGPPSGVPPAPVLRRQAAVLGVAESARVLETAVRIGLRGKPTAPAPPTELFWYADLPTPELWWRRLAGNVALHSVQFQNAVRIALGLGAARLVAGSLNLTHGFWVLLAVLTLGRTTTRETWTAVRKALAGTLVGAFTAAVLLTGIGQHTEAYAVALAPGMLAAFALGPLLGIAWAQAMFTLVVTFAFAQIAPTTWKLAEVRMVDVLTGSVIGLVCGLLAWPAGARREVRATMAELLRSCGPLVAGTVKTLVAVPPGSVPAPSTRPTLHRLRLAETAYAQYRSEPSGGAPVQADWHAVLIVANHALLGSQWLLHVDLPPDSLPSDAADWARATAEEISTATERIAGLCTSGKPPPQPPPPPPPTPGDPALPMLIDLEHWLRSLAAQLGRIEDSIRDAAESGHGRTVAGLAEGGS
ncbi:FUSC family protein [Streptomyces sp. NPDC059176]|uniref:FUSC family protein n=1 Tax=unclassified Streptomyces TaxID=2593676 RepID=UPI00369B39DB